MPSAAATATAAARTAVTTASVATPTPAARRTASPEPSPTHAASVLTASTAPAASPRPTAPSGSTLALTIQTYMFMPAHPSIHVGDSIRVTNRDAAPHTFTDKGGSFDTGQLGQNASKTLRFTRAGTFSFLCTVHPFMTGTLTVSR
jgi:plastocyanin